MSIASDLALAIARLGELRAECLREEQQKAAEFIADALRLLRRARAAVTPLGIPTIRSDDESE